MTTEADGSTGISRRQFLFLGAAATAATLVNGCQSMGGDGGGNSTVARPERVVDAGPASKYAADGLYGGFRDQGFFLVRNGDRLVALSSHCTHRKCKLTTDPDHSFFCPCHGSTFTPDGRVTEGPAKRDLPTLPSFTNETGDLFVRVPNS